MSNIGNTLRENVVLALKERGWKDTLTNRKKLVAEVLQTNTNKYHESSPMHKIWIIINTSLPLGD